MKTIPLLALLLTVPALVVAQPSVSTGGVRNAASARSGLPNTGVAPGAWFVIQGKNLGPTTAERADTPTNSVAGTSVQIVAGGQQWDAPLISVSAGEIAARMPRDVPAGSASISIIASSGTTTDAATVNVVASSFGVFTANQSDSGSAVFDQFRSGSNFSLYELASPVKPGEEVTLWGTGLGSAETEVEIAVQDTRATVVMKSIEENGVDRIKIQVPEGVTGCGLPVAVKTGDVRNLVGLLSISADGAVCLDATGYTREDIEKARSEGGLKAAYLFLMRYAMPGGAGAFDIGFANFSRVSYDVIRGYRFELGATSARRLLRRER